MNILRFSLSIFLLVGVAPISMAQDKVAKPVAEKKTPAVVWKDDEMCQFVFFAVLEGLYRDGVQNEIVDAIISDKPEPGEDGVKTHFVFRCELCHATYEAFRAYRQRPAFLNAEGVDTFGKGVDEKRLEALSSEDARTRVYSMGELIRPWIMHRIEETRKTPEEKTAMKEKFKAFTKEGVERLHEHRESKDKFYVDWNFYGSCQACEAAKDLGDRGF